MKRKITSFGKIWVCLLLICLVYGYAIAADKFIEMKTYKISKRTNGEIYYKDRIVFSGFSWIALAPDKREAGERVNFTAFPVAEAVEKEGYKEISFSTTDEPMGFTYKSLARLYPKKMVLTISYSFSKELKDYHLYINPVVSEDFALGAKYTVIDEDGLESEGIVEPHVKKYREIPAKGWGIQELVITNKNGESVKFRLKNTNSLGDANNLRFVYIREDGSWADGKEGGHIRLWLGQRPKEKVFPAGYENQLTLEVEFEE